MVVGCLVILGCARSLRERERERERERRGESMKEIDLKGSRENESIKEIIKNIEE